MIYRSLGFIIFLVAALSAQEHLDRSVNAVRFDQPPVMDGVVNDATWFFATPIEDFIQFQPRHGQPSRLRTSVYIGYRPDTLFIAFVCLDPEPERISAARTKRDSDLEEDDAVIVMLDTFDDDRTCTAFATNSIATQWDFRVS
ncbi:hypothetical protein ACFL45_11905, partial [Candidatus Neomarinimicrobiota bacterium]